jgi:hypothetical protein
MYIQIGLHLDDEGNLKSVDIQHNDTDVRSDSGLLKRIAVGLLAAIDANKEDIEVQDLLFESGIELGKE